ncbi:MAG: hypothetical protein GX798_04480 [Bacteroidales bacterium]|jgi:regulator of sirC expression with transglutaminase-like and TPR domain|nr:hypothetical protein [Bacteroidales bacterium]
MQTDLQHSLYALLDDTDQVVARSVTAEVLRQGPEMLSALEELASLESDLSVREEVGRRLEEIYYEMVINSMNEAARSEEEEQFHLLNFAVLITKLLYRGEDWRELVNAFVSKSAEMVMELSSGMTAMESCGVFNHIFFHRFGFKALPSEDLSPEYQMPATILNRGEGGKHVLMLLYFMFVQDCSLPVYPVEYRNTLIPAWIEEDKVLFCINVFNQGEMFFLPEEELVCRGYGFVPYAYLKELHSLFRKEGDSTRITLLERILPYYQALADS